jgi:hypothetical protein
MKKALLICAAAIVLLLLAGLGVVLRSGRLVSDKPDGARSRQYG